ncbi:hypothetical protein F5Y03DRAFT_393195 [Xylaria venustula]|nr:hypothetical protein F5Y03DRAFT_393195 [Xylaria venustula]
MVLTSSCVYLVGTFLHNLPLAELWMMFSFYSSMVMAFAIEVVNMMMFDSIIAFLIILYHLFMVLVCILKRLRDEMANAKSLAELLTRSGNGAFLSRRLRISRSAFHSILFFIGLQAPLVIEAQPVFSQSPLIGKESSYSDILSLSMHLLSTGISPGIYQIIGLSIALITGIGGISAAIWGPCLPSWWNDRRRTQPDPERREDIEQHTRDHGRSVQRRSDHLNATSFLNEEQDTGSPRHTQSIDEPGSATGEETELSSFTHDREYYLLNIGAQFPSSSIAQSSAAYPTECPDSEHQGAPSAVDNQGTEIPVAPNTQATLTPLQNNIESSVATAPPDLTSYHSGLMDGLIKPKKFPPFCGRSDTVAGNEMSLNESMASSTRVATEQDSGGSIFGCIGFEGVDWDVTKLHRDSHETQQASQDPIITVAQVQQPALQVLSMGATSEDAHVAFTDPTLADHTSSAAQMALRVGVEDEDGNDDDGDNEIDAMSALQRRRTA